MLVGSFYVVLAQENRVMRGEVVALRRTYTHADALESNDGMICIYPHLIYSLSFLSSLYLGYDTDMM